MNAKDLIRGLVIALVASGITLGVDRLLTSTEQVGAVSRPVAGNDRNQEIEAALARLESLLAERQLAPVERPRAPVEESSEPGPDEEPVADEQIREVLERLDAIERLFRLPPVVMKDQQPLDRLRPPNAQAIHAAIELKVTDRRASELDLHMRTMQEMVERFGFPEETGACNGGGCEFYWKYELPSADPEDPHYFAVYFTDGRVAWTEGAFRGG